MDPGTVPSALLQSVASSLGLQPRQIVPERDGLWRVHLAPGSRMTVVEMRLLQPTAYRNLRNELTALRWLGPRLPVASEYRVFADPRLPVPGAVRAATPGRSGVEMAADPARALLLARNIGALAARLASFEAPRHGTIGDGATYLPRYASWGEECIARVGSARQSARATGLDLGETADALVELVRASRAAIDANSRFSLVHGSLSPAAVRVDDAGVISGVADFEGACFGDALLDVAPALFLDEPAWRAFLDGYGPIAALDSEDGRRRLTAYAATQVLERVASARIDARIGARMERARCWARCLLDGGFVSRRLAGPVPLPSPDARRARFTRVLHRVASVPVLGTDEVFPLLGALAGVELQEESVADSLTEDLGRARGPRNAPAGMDLSAWRASLPALLAPALQRPHIGVSRGLPAAWLVLVAVDAVADSVGGATLAALSETLAAAVALDLVPLERVSTKEEASSDLVCGTIELGALAGLAGMLPALATECRTRSERVEARVRRAAATLDLTERVLEGFDTGLAPLEDSLRGAPLVRQQRLLPVVLLALRVLAGRSAPWAPPEAYLAALGRSGLSR